MDASTLEKYGCAPLQGGNRRKMLSLNNSNCNGCQ